QKIKESGLRTRVDSLFKELDSLRPLRRDARNTLVRVARKQQAYKILRKIPRLGPVRVAQIIAAVGSPHRFRTRAQFWTYCGLAVVTRSSADYQFREGQLVRRSGPAATRGLNRNFNRRLKYVLKSAAADVIREEPFRNFYQVRIQAGMRPEMARLTIAR